jgi:hypothetical protein
MSSLIVPVVERPQKGFWDPQKKVVGRVRGDNDEILDETR